ncbi:SCO2322 family protein [Streptomyces sp. NPDC090025]|uniref:SCO2322 family protein n=1 Tax=Streptomyces sp. NPDC090025 TaxID=3365922 RepID=UPI0038353798
MSRRTAVRLRLAAGLGGALLMGAAVAAPAQAAGTGYRYWSFWEDKGGSWGYATQGPATARPADGDALGFRFAVSRDAADATKPTAAPDFAKTCAATAAKDGTKRVALVIDFGTTADAPPGETPPSPAVRSACARVREDATAAEALAEVAKPLRYDSNALLCGISGYPKAGCGEAVALPDPGSSTAAPSAVPSATGSAAASADAHPGSGGPSVGLLAGGAAVVVLGAAGIWQARRRR